MIVLAMLPRKQSPGQVLHANISLERGSCNPNEIRSKEKRKWRVWGEGKHIEVADLATVYQGIQLGHHRLLR